jgi:uncharacterized protein YggE
MNEMENGPWSGTGLGIAIRVAIIGVLAILALYLFALTIATVENFGTSANPPTNTITVTGEGMATAVPDTATISFGGTATASDPSTAETQLTNTLKSAIATVEGEGVPASDVTTSSYNVSPHYSEPTCAPGVMCPAVSSSASSGYDVSETVTVKVTDTSKVSKVLGDLARANVTDVTGPDLEVGDPSAVQSQARGLAIQDAQKQAQVLASQLGVHLGKIASFTDNSSGGIVRPMMATAGVAESDTSAPDPSVPVGNNQYTDDVSITYEIN